MLLLGQRGVKVSLIDILKLSSEFDPQRVSYICGIVPNFS